MRVLARAGADYPAGLRDLPDAPPAVHVRGGALPHPARAVAIVGSRAASPYGLAMAHALARDLAAGGVTIVSGLARGIDAAAHRGALDAGGRTLGVVPMGLDVFAAGAGAELAAALDARGTVLTEVASGPAFGPGAFVKRNRLIAALAGVTVVVEAAARSGALSTARIARRLGRGLCAVPGDVDRPTARGVLELLRTGARACADAGDVLAAMPPALAAAPAADASPDDRLLAALADGPQAADALAARSALPLPEVLAALLRLRWAGRVAAVPGGRWRAGREGP